MPVKDHDYTGYCAWPLLICLTVVLALATGCGLDVTPTRVLTASTSQITIYPGQQDVGVNVTATVSDYSGPIVITMTGLPSGVTATPFTLTSGGSGILNLSASPSAGQEGFPTTVPQ